MTPSDIAAATKAFVRAWRKDVVSPEEIARRSRICKTCPAKEKSFFGGLLGQILQTEGVLKLLAEHKCGICKCPLSNLIPAVEVHVDSDREKKRRQKANPNCWMLK